MENDSNRKKVADMKKLRADWMHQSSEKASIDSRRRSDATPLDVAACGVSALQTFAGEDSSKRSRELAQAVQLREWNDAEIRAKAERRRVEEEQEAHYSSRLTRIVGLQDSLQEEYDATHQLRKELIARDNDILQRAKTVREREERERELRAETLEINANVESPLLREDPNQSISVSEGRVRTDHWKGMDASERREILLSNDQETEAKRREKERGEEEVYATQQRLISRHVEREEYASRKRRDDVNSETKKTLALQVEEARRREKEGARDARGEIENGFFDNFSRSFC
jgi:hypothetical protein